MTQAAEAEPFLGRLENPPGPDPILILMTEYQNDTRADKINGGIGVINNDQGKLWTSNAILIASERTPILQGGYVVPEGPLEWGGKSAFLEGTIRLVFQDLADKLLAENRVAAIGTSGGTHAVAMFAETVKITQLGSGRPPRIIMGSPPYPNHPTIFQSRGLEIDYFPQLRNNGTYDVEANLRAMKDAPDGSVLLMHGGAHNPTGINPATVEQWRIIAAQAKGKLHRVLFDAPYLGLDGGLIADTYPVRIFIEENVPVAVAVSFSKIGSMYAQRTGALLIPAPTFEAALDTNRVLNAVVRADISSPPAVGEAIMGLVLLDAELHKAWNHDLDQVARVLRLRRQILANALPGRLQAPVRLGAGLFTLLPLSPEATAYLKKSHAIYVVGSGRVNIGGIPTGHMERFAHAVSQALRKFPTKYNNDHTRRVS